MISANTINNVRRRKLRLQLNIARPIIRKIVREKNRFIDEAIQSYIQFGALREELVNDHAFNLEQIMTFYYNKIIRSQAADTLSFLRRRRRKKSYMFHMKQDDDEMLYTFLQREWLKKHGFEKVKTVAGTTKKNIQRRFMKGFDEGLSIQEIAKEMRSPTKGVKVLSLYEAERIAHTEMGIASSFASEETALDVQKQTGNRILKKWVYTPDARTRTWHKEVSQDWIGLDESFSVGGEDLKYPLDPSGSPKNIIRCRCRSIQEEEQYI